MTIQKYILNISFADHSGLIAAVATELSRIGSNIVEWAQFREPEVNRFFMRIAFQGDAARDEIEAALSAPLKRFGMDVSLTDAARARAVKLHLEHQVMMNVHKTVIFS